MLFVIFTLLGFYGARWRRGDLSKLHEWALAGRRLGTFLAWFLIGADVYTAYTFVAVPSGMFASGALYFYAVPYVATTFMVAMITMPVLWKWSRERGYVTAADMVADRFSNRILAALVALTGIVAELPYIALQIIGMQAVLGIMLLGVTSNVTLVSDVALTVSFVILAAFTFTSGLRGATLGAVLKDALIFLSLISLIIIVPLKFGGFSSAFADAQAFASALSAKHITWLSTGVTNLKPTAALEAGYTTLWVGSALALFLYPHAVNGSLSASGRRQLALSNALLPIYGIGLAILALLGLLVYSDPVAMGLLSKFPLSARGIYSIPALAVSSLPGWFAGVVLLGIFIGGLVPAAIMAIAQANLLTRNIIRPLRPEMNSETETRIAKWASVIFKFVALGFVFIVPATYAIQLQLLGGIIILQTLPSVFLGLVTRRLNGYALTAGLLVGLASGIYMVEVANKFGPLSTSLLSMSGYLIWIGLLALVLNVTISVILSLPTLMHRR
ncbi:Acetate permease ActP [Conexivisphaera calida]|uniref:Acetate permease ActP n=1 Tax=Conexivisphaera calida TaxID=1874277 RepID=A0A4V0P1M9_9ARCH|nr:sodium:solute symporter [Conexivisphaera calida]BBE42280.1 Acetate permease ActP [Conexivisphaera calida]